MVKLFGILSQFNPVEVLVMGDFMVDVATSGKVRRVSPEAPVSVLHVQKEESRPGGAGNVALNLVSLGATVTVVGRVGIDSGADVLRSSLQAEGVKVEGLLSQQDFKTPLKNRLIADAQQILRVDFETISAIPEELEKQITLKLPELLENIQILAISDYGKGFLSRSLLKTTIESARKKGIAVIVDPKGEDFSKYEGATVLKPNAAEAYAAAKLPLGASLDEVAAKLLESVKVDLLLITRSELGMSLFTKDGTRFDFPVRSKEVKDVTGAGDTVLSMISVALANGLDIKYAAQLANVAAGMAIERLGCARINLAEMAGRLLEFDVDNKIFDEEHLFALMQVLKGTRYSVLGLDSTHGMTTALFRSIRQIALRNIEQKLIIYVRDADPDEEFASLLTSLAEVDFVVLQSESLKNLCEIIQPHEVFVMEGPRLVTLDHPTVLLNKT